MHTCNVCKKEFKGWPTNPNKYCSIKCRNNHYTIHPQFLPCEYCGKDFKVDTGNLKKGGGKCCSKRCMGLSKRKPLIDTFWENVIKTNKCWLWTGSTDGHGYGHMFRERKEGNKTIKAYRFSYEIHNGPIPKGLVIMHVCDNPPCVNPKHLFLGTFADNVHDACKKGRCKHKSHIKNQSQ
jgi:hypothetical protein